MSNFTDIMRQTTMNDAARTGFANYHSPVVEYVQAEIQHATSAGVARKILELPVSKGLRRRKLYGHLFAGAKVDPTTTTYFLRAEIVILLNNAVVGGPLPFEVGQIYGVARTTKSLATVLCSTNTPVPDCLVVNYSVPFSTAFQTAPTFSLLTPFHFEGECDLIIINIIESFNVDEYKMFIACASNSAQ